MDFGAGYDEALARYRAGNREGALALAKALQQQYPDEPLLLNLLGALHIEAGDFATATSWFERALVISPDDVAVRNNLGVIALRSGDFLQAERQYRHAVRSAPEGLDTLLGLGQALYGLRRYDEAIKVYRLALRHHPTQPDLMFKLALSEYRAQRIDDACRDFEALLTAHPDHQDGIVNLLYALHFRMPAYPARIAERSRELGRCIEIRACAGQPVVEWKTAPDPDKRLRIGLLSGDLIDHPVGYFIEGLLRDANSRQVDWVAFHNNTSKTLLTQRIQPLFSAWHDIKTLSDTEVAQRIADERIDVLVDLSGYTEHHRLSVFARRPAPLQLSWLGYFGTLGMDCIDAVIADPISVPPQEEAWFSERIVHLPATRLCMSPPIGVPDVVPLPALHNGHITFGCFGRMPKINDAVLSVWGSIARQVPQARFHFQNGELDTPELAARFRQRLAGVGLSEDRVQLSGPLKRGEYFAAHGQVDVVLDTFCHTAGTTTVDALWMGVPTLTLTTPGMLGRQGEMMLSAAGLPEWIARNTQDYIAKAVHWAQPDQWPALATLRANMREHLVSQPLFDQVTFAAHWHALVRQLWRERCNSPWSVPGRASLPEPSPAQVEARLAHASELFSTRRYEDALNVAMNLREAVPQHAGVLNLLGRVQLELRDFDRAVASFQSALDTTHDPAAVICNLGEAKRRQGRLQEAAAAFRDVLERFPDHPLALSNLGATLYAGAQYDEAIECFERLRNHSALGRQMRLNIAHSQRGMGRFREACAEYEALIAEKPDDIGVYDNLLFALHYCVPLPLDTIARYARARGKRVEAASAPLAARTWKTRAKPDKRLRIGLLTGDLRDHPVGFFFEGLLCDPASRQVDWLAFNSHAEETVLTHRIKPHFSEWHSVVTMSDASIAERIRESRVDVLLDLSGLTANHRLGVFTLRPAPLQLTWLGYFGTTGMTCFDALIADACSVPEAEAHGFTEPVARLPSTRLCLSPPLQAPAIAPLPAMANGHITFGCYQNIAKINDAVLEAWRAIAASVPDARFVVRNAAVGNAVMAERFRTKLSEFGIDPQRVHLSPVLGHMAYFASYGEVDLMLDTFCYPGGTTTAEALWMGVPTLTLSTPGMLGRQGEMMLSAAGLPEWIARNTQDYIAKAVHWAQPDQWPALATLRANMREHLVSQPLFDQATFAAHWHALVRELWRQRCEATWPVAT